MSTMKKISVTAAPLGFRKTLSVFPTLFHVYSIVLSCRSIQESSSAAKFSVQIPLSICESKAPFWLKDDQMALTINTKANGRL